MHTINLLPGEREPTPDELNTGVVVTAEYWKHLLQEAFRVIFRPSQVTDAIAAVRAQWEGKYFSNHLFKGIPFNDIDAHLLIAEIEAAAVVPSGVV